jgi:hypothetical protein
LVPKNHAWVARVHQGRKWWTHHVLSSLEELYDNKLDELIFDYLAFVLQELKLREEHLVSCRRHEFVFLNFCARAIWLNFD